MFSTIPRIRTPVFLQKVISLLTSPVDTACKKIHDQLTLSVIHKRVFLLACIRWSSSSVCNNDPNKRNIWQHILVFAENTTQERCSDGQCSYLPYYTKRVFFFLPHSDMYLRGGDQNGSIHSVLLKVFQYGQMLIWCPGRRVHQQHIQLSPSYIWHKLTNQSCG